MSSPPFNSSRQNSLTLELSVVVPAFNEEQRLPKTLQSIRAYLKSRALRAEVLVVDDGSTDATAKVVEASQRCFPELQLISNSCNRGKGFSVRQGMLEARGEITLFTDADLSAPIEEADKLLAVLREGAYDGAIGSRALDRRLIEVHQSMFRERAGILFNRIVRWLGLVVAMTLVLIIISGFSHFDVHRAFDFPAGAFRLNRAFFAGLGGKTTCLWASHLGSIPSCGRRVPAPVAG